jgi:hypothetical protein
MGRCWGMIGLKLLAAPWFAVGKAEGFGVEEAGDRHFDHTFDRVFNFSGTIDEGGSDSFWESFEDGLGVGGG